jgi:ABC-type phosphate transport system substrate-binding protein
MIARRHPEGDRMKRRLLAFCCAALAAVATVVVSDAPASAAVVYSHIEGDGSTWAQNLLNVDISAASQQGMDVVYTGVGSAQGRKDFANGTTDFGVTDLPYQGIDPVTGIPDSSTRPYAYLPIAAGGTAFPYQIRVNGRLVTNLRLSGLTLAKVFTNQITNWDDPAITADNNGQALPSLPIIPVVHAEGSGASWQFTAYLGKQYPQIWAPYNNGSDVATEYFPRQGQAVAQNGSDGVMNYLTSLSANGAIAYDEYSYALAKGYPVAKVGNAAGYFVAPAAANVSLSLTRAVVDTNAASPTYLTANLDGVYSYNDPRAYPLSSYSYLIMPTSGQDPRMTTSKRQTLADFVDDTVCAGQQAGVNIGYSPLSRNLVQSALDQLQQLKTADAGVDLSADGIDTCTTPTLGPPPQPPLCDQIGQGPCPASDSGPALVPVPITAQDNSAPYAGSLSLNVTSGVVQFQQVDPATPAGHPAVATDPTGHRHAWVFQAPLGDIAVVDTRPSEPGWTLTGEATDFVNGGTTVPARDLGWTPQLVPAGSDAEGVLSPGPSIGPFLSTGFTNGLAMPLELANAAPGNGLGTQNLGATLVLWMPDTSPTGTYASTLTLTLISP